MRRLSLILLILLALVVSPVAVYAQDDDLPIACGTLSDEDCEFLKMAREATMALESYSTEFSMDAALTDVPNLPPDLGFSMQMLGTFSVNPELSARMVDLQKSAAEDPMAMMEGTMAVAQDFYADTAADITFSFQLTDDLADFAAASAGLPIPQSLDIPVRLVEGVAYADPSAIADFVGEEPTGWMGVDMVGALEMSSEQALAQMESGLMSDPSMSAFFTDFGAGSALQESFIEFVEVERLEDSEVDDVAVAQFLYTFDLAGFVSSPDFVEMLTAQVEGQMAMMEAMGGEQSLTEEDVAMITMALPMIAPMLFANLQWETVSAVGLEDGLTRASETTIAWDLSQLAQVATMMLGVPVERPERGAEAGMFTLNIFSRSSDFGADVDVEAPEDAILVPLDEMD